MATLTFQGAAGEVTGSRYLIELDGNGKAGKLLLECGLHQDGPEADRLNAIPFGSLARELCAVVISHGHLDHAGLLPKLVREGYRGPIYCTHDTRDLLGIMLADAAFVMARDIEWENKWRHAADKTRLEALYDLDDVELALSLCERHGYGKPVSLPGGVTLVFRDAGHILGAAIVELGLPSGGRHQHLVFSGDLGNSCSVLVNDPEKVCEADTVLMESTYGDRNHRPLEKTLEEFARVLDEAHMAGGNVLIPAFAVGRTQEIIYHLSVLHHEGRLKQQRIFLDSPLAIRVTELYAKRLASSHRADLNVLDVAAQSDVSLHLPGLRLARSVEESMAINRIRGGAIIIAGAGMCNGGRILHHLRYNLARASTRVVMVGFQAAGTLGKRLVDGTERVKVLGEELPVRARIHALDGFSAHADQ